MMDLPAIEGFKQIARFLNIKSTVRLSSTCKDLRHHLYRPIRERRSQEIKERLSYLYLKNRLGPKLYERKKWLLKVFNPIDKILDLGLIYGVTIIFKNNPQGYRLSVGNRGGWLLLYDMENAEELESGLYAYTLRDYLYTNPFYIYDLVIKVLIVHGSTIEAPLPEIYKIIISYDNTPQEQYKRVQIYNLRYFDEIWYHRKEFCPNGKREVSRECTMKKKFRTELKDYMKTWIMAN